MSDLAVLAPEVDASLPADVPSPTGIQAATSAVVDELRAEASRYDERAGSPSETGRDASDLLRLVAGRLAQRRGWLAVDGLVHELVSDLVQDALGVGDGRRVEALAARAFALKAIARHPELWPGAGPRLGSSFSYESLLASIRLTALAGEADPA